MSDSTGLWLGAALWAIGVLIPSLWGLFPLGIGAIMIGYYGMGVWNAHQARKHADREVRGMWDDPDS